MPEVLLKFIQWLIDTTQLHIYYRYYIFILLHMFLMLLYTCISILLPWSNKYFTVFLFNLLSHKISSLPFFTIATWPPSKARLVTASSFRLNLDALYENCSCVASLLNMGMYFQPRSFLKMAWQKSVFPIAKNRSLPNKWASDELVLTLTVHELNSV